MAEVRITWSRIGEDIGPASLVLDIFLELARLRLRTLYTAMCRESYADGEGAVFKNCLYDKEILIAQAKNVLKETVAELRQLYRLLRQEVRRQLKPVLGRLRLRKGDGKLVLAYYVGDEEVKTWVPALTVTVQ